MAAAETARLISSLELQDKFSKTADTAILKTKGLESAFRNLGGTATQGLKTAAGNIAKVGAVGLGAVTVGATKGLSSLADLEDATTAVQGAIDATGQTGKVTAEQVAAWANQIETAVQAAFDDKEITAAAATLLRFGNVTTTNLRPALVVMTDLAAKTGSVDSAAEKLAKALVDPTKAAKTLKDAGVVLTKEEQDQIKVLVEAGKKTEAQTFLLDRLSRSTKGAAAASKGPYRDALNILADSAEDVERALATGLLPVIQKFSEKVVPKLQDPATLKAIEGFGNELASGFSSALDTAEHIPWATIGEALRIGGDGAKAIAGAFSGIPPETKGLLLALAGLDKLTGGAPVKLAVDIAQGAFGQFLGRGATPANPMWVQAAGGLGGGGAGGAAGAAGSAGGIGLGVAVPVIGATVAAAIAAGAFDTQRIQDLGLIGRTQEQLRFATDNKNLADIVVLQRRLEALQSGGFYDITSAALATGKSVDDVNRTLDEKLAAIAGAESDVERQLRANLQRPIPAPSVTVNNTTHVDVNISGQDVSSITLRDRLASQGITYTSGGRVGF